MAGDNIFAALLQIGAGNVAAAQPHLEQFHEYANARLSALNSSFAAPAAELVATAPPALAPAAAPRPADEA